MQVGAAHFISIGLRLTVSEPVYPGVLACFYSTLLKCWESLEYKCISSVMVTLHGLWAKDGSCQVVLVVLWCVLHSPAASDWPNVKGTAGQAAGQPAQVVVGNRVEVWGSVLLKVQTESSSCIRFT